MSKNKDRRIQRLNDGSIAAQRLRKLKAMTPEVLASVTARISQPKLSGLQIRSARLNRTGAVPVAVKDLDQSKREKSSSRFHFPSLRSFRSFNQHTKRTQAAA